MPHNAAVTNATIITDLVRMPNPTSPKPVVGITTDVRTIESLERRVGSANYANAVNRAGGVPIFMDTDPALIPQYRRLCDAFVLTGGDDPLMEPWGIETHPASIRVHQKRQAFELELLNQIGSTPTLGVCLGMQYMALHAGGTLDQHMPETIDSAGQHWDQDHPVQPAHGSGLQGIVHSKHRQAITDPGSLQVIARSHDGVIEAIQDPERPFYIGVQWHPERTADDPLGIDLFKRLLDAART